VRADPAQKGLLYAGTETGVYVSWDDGGRWQSLQLKLPVVPVTDLVVKDDDLVISTQGRGFWILDDLSPVRQASPTLVSAGAHLYKPRPAYRFFGGSGRRPRPGVGQNPPDGAIVYYFLENAPKEKDEITLQFLDGSGKVLRSVSNLDKKDKDGEEKEGESEGGSQGEDDEGGAPKKIPAKAGLNRFAWNLRLEEATKVKKMILWGGGTDGPVVVPGTYQVKLVVGDKSRTQPVEVRKDPRLGTTQVEYEKQFDLFLKIRDTLSQTHDAILRIRAAREQVGAAADRAKSTPEERVIGDAAEALEKKLTAVEEELYQTKNKAEQDPLNYPIRLNNKLAWLANVVGSADAAPTDAVYAVFENISRKVAAQLATLEKVLSTDLPAFNQLVKDKGVPAVVLKPEKR
jgi:hypothetical protein